MNDLVWLPTVIYRDEEVGVMIVKGDECWHAYADDDMGMWNPYTTTTWEDRVIAPTADAAMAWASRICPVPLDWQEQDVYRTACGDYIVMPDGDDWYSYEFHDDMWFCYDLGTKSDSAQEAMDDCDDYREIEPELMRYWEARTTSRACDDPAHVQSEGDLHRGDEPATGWLDPRADSDHRPFKENGSDS